MAGLINAHGFTVEVTAQAVTLSPSLLAHALGGQQQRVEISQVSSVDVVSAPSAFAPGRSVLTLADGTTIDLPFPPNESSAQQSLSAAIEAALRGEAPQEAAVAGLNFAAVDVETANDDWGSICQIGVTKVIDGNIVGTSTWLCQPPAPISQFEELNIQIHGITADDVANEPPFAEVLPLALAEIGDLPVVAHNAQFDMTAFYRACLASETPVPELTFGCTLALARAGGLGLQNHRLPTVAEHFGFDLKTHHNAGADAEACAAIFVGLARHGHARGDFATVFSHLGFTPGTLNSQRVYPVLKKVTDRAETGVGASEADSGNASQPSAQNASRRAPWAKVATPEVAPEASADADPSNRFYGHNVTLTGDFEPFDKGLLWQKLADNGATIGKNVTKKTTMLVIGPWASVTSKQKRAEELREKGQDITFLTSQELFTELGLDADEQPPF